MHLNRNGVGDLVQQGVWYPVPQNPLNNPNNSLSNPILEAQVSAKVAGRAKGVGDLVTGDYPLPWNPIVNGGSSLNRPRTMMCDKSNALATSVASMAAGPTGNLSGFDLATAANAMGMGDFSVSGVDDFLNGTTFGYSNALVFGGAALAAWFLFANQKKKGSSRVARARRTVASAF